MASLHRFPERTLDILQKFKNQFLSTRSLCTLIFVFTYQIYFPWIESGARLSLAYKGVVSISNDVSKRPF